MDPSAIDKVLPQTQCEECGFKGCKPYAEALSKDKTSIDLCAPGGVEVLFNIADLLNKNPQPYIKSVEENTRPPALAKIREQECIGCTKCIQACPVDAIIGSNKKMHTVFTDECTGCRLCVDPCPVDCIEIHEVKEDRFDKQLAKKRFENRAERLKNLEQAKRQKYKEKRTLNNDDDKKAKQAYILEILKKKNEQK